MGIFEKSSASIDQETKKIESEVISSIVDKSMIITGSITFKGKARIDGVINGNIEGEHLVLSETGRINGDIIVSSFNCYGTIEGNIKTNMLTARKNCSINGKLESGSLTVESGAAIQGEIKVATDDLKPIDRESLTTKE